jgi:hypothetical protein
MTRDEIVHSLLEADFRPAGAGDPGQRLRVRRTDGFSGPESGDPSLTLIAPDSSAAQILVFDDTGNRFRRSPEQWPDVLTGGQPRADAVAIYKLHRPLPQRAGNGVGNPLWSRVKERFGERRVVVISVDDLRDLGAPISQGLSWERTALDVVWQLLNVESFSELRDCPHLVVRLAIDGALYWRTTGDQGQPQHRAWVFYDPDGIEGTGESRVPGMMVGYGSAFVAGIVGGIARAGECPASSISSTADGVPDGLEAGVIAGLQAARKLLVNGFARAPGGALQYPSEELFDPAALKDFFACEEIPIIPHSLVPDRGYWRLLDSLFDGQREELHAAVALTVTGGQPTSAMEQAALAKLRRAPRAVFAQALRTFDRREIESYRALYGLMRDYVRQINPPRPLSVAVFGPPGAGKSFGVKMVARSLAAVAGPRPIETLTFNLSQYHEPEALADAFHLVRDMVLRGKVPLVFFDEFDTSLHGVALGWLRYFLAPMQDAEFLDRGTPHPIGQAIFVFAGGTCATYAEFARPFLQPNDAHREAFKLAKGPDFLSRLRATLDIPGLDLDAPFDAYGPVEAFPCEAAILLRRAGILAHQLREKAPQLRDSGGALRISPAVLRGLLHLPKFLHGNRSFEALLELSRLTGNDHLQPWMLPSASQAALHANPLHLNQHVATEFPFPPADREIIAESIHEVYLETRLKSDQNQQDAQDPALRPWAQLPADCREKNYEQVDDIAYKLRAAGLWFRKLPPGESPASVNDGPLLQVLDRLARSEHDRFVAHLRRQGWIAAAGQRREDRRPELKLHNSLFPWEQLSAEARQLDEATVRSIPKHLAKAGYEIIVP